MVWRPLNKNPPKLNRTTRLNTQKNPYNNETVIDFLRRTKKKNGKGIYQRVYCTPTRFSLWTLKFDITMICLKYILWYLKVYIPYFFNCPSCVMNYIIFARIMGSENLVILQCWRTLLLKHVL